LKEKQIGSSYGRQSFLQGAIILTIGMVIVKLVGALFKVPLKYIIGEYGMGLFNVAYNFYGPIFSLATAGFPIAIARLVSHNYSLGRFNDVKSIKRISVPIFTAIGIFGTTLMMLTAPVYCINVIKNENALMPMLALGPAILFSCLAAIYRGYYEGLKDMYPTAVSQVVEAIIKLAAGLSLALGILTYCEREYSANSTVFGVTMTSADNAAFATFSYAAAGAILGVTLGSVFSFLYLFIRYKRRGDGITVKMYRGAPRPRSDKVSAKLLVITAIPIAIGSITTNIAGLIDTTFLQSRVLSIIESSPNILIDMYSGMIPQIYFDNVSTIPNFLYGCYTLSLTIYMLVPSLTQAFGISALPSVTEAWVRGDKAEIKYSIEAVIRITALVCFPAGLGISALSKPISSLLYGDDISTPIVSNALFILGFASVAAALNTPISSMLQAVGRIDLPVKMLFAAMIIKIGVNYYLCGIPKINIMGAGVGTLLCYLFLVIGEVILLCRVTKIKIDLISTFLKPLISALFSVIAAYEVFNLADNFLVDKRLTLLIQIIISMFFAAVTYVSFLLIFKAIDKKDVLMLPMGQKIAKTLEKYGWI